MVLRIVAGLTPRSNCRATVREAAGEAVCTNVRTTASRTSASRSLRSCSAVISGGTLSAPQNVVKRIRAFHSGPGSAWREPTRVGSLGQPIENAVQHEKAARRAGQAPALLDEELLARESVDDRSRAPRQERMAALHTLGAAQPQVQALQLSLGGGEELDER